MLNDAVENFNIGVEMKLFTESKGLLYGHITEMKDIILYPTSFFEGKHILLNMIRK